MDAEGLIDSYIESQPDPKRGELRELHRRILQLAPASQLWFVDGTDKDGRTVSNPNIGYGLQTLRYADGRTREFYKIGLSANKTGISIYVLGLADQTYLARTFGSSIGKASISAYCIKFKRLADVDLETLEAALRHGFDAEREDGA